MHTFKSIILPKVMFSPYGSMFSAEACAALFYMDSIALLLPLVLLMLRLEAEDQGICIGV